MSRMARADWQRGGSILLGVAVATLIAACQSALRTGQATCTRADSLPCPLPQGDLGRFDSAQVQTLLTAYDFEDDAHSAHGDRKACAGSCQFKIRVRPEKRVWRLDEATIEPNGRRVIGLVAVVGVIGPATPNDSSDDFGIHANESAYWVLSNSGGGLKSEFWLTSRAGQPLAHDKPFQRCDRDGSPADSRSRAEFVSKTCTVPAGKPDLRISGTPRLSTKGTAFLNPPPLWVTCQAGCCTSTL